MAIQTKLSDIPNNEKRISSLQTEAGSYQDRLNTSPTALGGGGEPTSFDVSNQESLARINKEIQGLTDANLRAKWYGPEKKGNSQQEESSPGFFRTALDALSLPLYGIVGATKHVIGQGSGSLQEDVADNIKRNKNTFSDVLRTSGAHGSVAAPLGFALDVMFDPVNWATAGTAALIPKLAVGAYKGVQAGNIAKGVALAAKSNVLGKATTISRITPGFRKSETFSRLGEKSIKATNEWEDFSGINAASIALNKGIIGVRAFGYHGSLLDVVKKVADKTPGGNVFLKNFIYDPTEWVRSARIKDIFQRALGSEVDISGAVNANVKGESIAPFMKETEEKFAAKMEAAPVSPPRKIAEELNSDIDPPSGLPTSKEIELKTAELDRLGLSRKIEDASPWIVNEADDAASILNDPKPFVSSDAIENELRIKMEGALRSANETIGGEAITMEDVAKMVKSGVLEETGVRWFDNMMKGVKNFTIKTDRNSGKVLEVGKKTMNAYERAMGIFRVAKVAASPTAWVNAVVGNLLMAHMAGLHIWDPRYLKRLNQSKDLYRNKTGKGALFDGLLADAGGGIKGGDTVRRFLGDNSTAARGTFGDISYIGDPSRGKKGLSEYATERLMMNGRDGNVLPQGVTAETIRPQVNEALDEITAMRDTKMAQAEAEFAERTAEAKLPSKSGVAMTKKAIKDQKEAYLKLHPEDTKFSNFTIDRSELGTGMMSQELMNSRVTAEMFDFIAEKARKDPSNVAWKLLDFTFNKMPEGYEKVDQANKMAVFLYATHDGISINEVRKLSKLVDITPEELALGKYVSKEAGETLYRLSPDTALKLSNIMFLNYAAMPAAVRVMRNMPIMGSPFVSFMYGMSLKTMQTMAYNPAAFNKVTFAMNDFGGTKTPLEKKELDTESYSYLKEPGMFRTPFFDENPIYLNMSSMIPYYSLNMFNPSQTKYGDSAREKLVQAWQSSSVMSDPAGRVLFDYFIQPLILGEAIRPQGTFGQPLYPLDATGVEKLGYGARTLGEAFVPNIAAYAGLLTPEGAADYIPSYRWRQLAQAKEGKNQLGISSKEAPTSRTVRTLLQASGIPVQSPVNLNFQKKEEK